MLSIHNTVGRLIFYDKKDFVHKYKASKIFILEILCSIVATMLITFILENLCMKIFVSSKLSTIREILYPRKEVALR